MSYEMKAAMQCGKNVAKEVEAVIQKWKYPADDKYQMPDGSTVYFFDWIPAVFFKDIEAALPQFNEPTRLKAENATEPWTDIDDEYIYVSIGEDNSRNTLESYSGGDVFPDLFDVRDFHFPKNEMVEDFSIPKNQKHEFYDQLIQMVEDFLGDYDITLPRSEQEKEKNTDINSAYAGLICGSDYDELQERFSEVMHRWKKE